jgi:hypothetical protein
MRQVCIWTQAFAAAWAHSGVESFLKSLIRAHGRRIAAEPRRRITVCYGFAPRRSLEATRNDGGRFGALRSLSSFK